MKYLMVLGTVVLFLGVGFAAEQPPTPTVITPPSTNYYGGGGYPVGYHHASTAAEGRLRGMGDLVRSQGQANLDNSAAAVNLTAARQNQINNYRASTSAYFDMREVNRRARAAERGPKPTMEQLVRLAQAGKPKPLSPSELDTVTGDVHWPAFLQTDAFARDRGKMESIFAQRATSGGLGAEQYVQARQTTDSMLAELKKQIREIPPEQYVLSRKFLESLAYAASQPAT